MSNQPAKKFRIGYVTATVWANEGNGDTTFYTVDISRTFKDGDDYRSTNSLNQADLLNAAFLLQQANRWIIEQ